MNWKSLRQHSDDLVRFAVDHQRAADDRVALAKPPLPVAIRDHHGLGRVCRIVALA